MLTGRRGLGRSDPETTPGIGGGTSREARLRLASLERKIPGQGVDRRRSGTPGWMRNKPSKRNRKSRSRRGPDPHRCETRLETTFWSTNNGLDKILCGGPRRFRYTLGAGGDRRPARQRSFRSLVGARERYVGSTEERGIRRVRVQKSSPEIPRTTVRRSATRGPDAPRVCKRPYPARSHSDGCRRKGERTSSSGDHAAEIPRVLTCRQAATAARRASYAMRCGVPGSPLPRGP